MITSQPEEIGVRSTPSSDAARWPISKAAPKYSLLFGSWPSHGGAIATPTLSSPLALI